MTSDTTTEHVDSHVAIDENGQHHVVQISEDVRYSLRSDGSTMRRILAIRYTLMNGTILTAQSDGVLILPTGERLRRERGI